MYASSFVPDTGLVSEMLEAKTSYRREFDEMENRIRKCERERAELERRFADLMRERADCERTAARVMKERHKRQIEADRQRAERNESILRMLNKIDLQAASLAAKTDRLKMLKTQYEVYLMRTWSSTQHTGYQAAPAMIMAPPPAPKSEFVHYLSELTHQQTASLNMIPPPTALSSYLASQQKAMPILPSFASTADDSFTRKHETSAPMRNDISTVPSVGGTKAKRFEMSNEDFIRYIDSEVLKEPIPSVNVVAPSPELSKQNQGAYLEDVTVSEDEQRAPVVDGLSETLDQFSIVENSAKALGNKEELSWADVADKDYSQQMEDTGKEAVVTTEQQEQVSSSADGYHRDENVMYQEPQYDATSYGNETQQTVTEAYQYQTVEGQYQEGQYVEGAATDQSLYQYQEGTDQTNPYDTSSTYLDPSQQQYQYDENAQYYNQQQNYGEGQYYSENTDQQAQQQQQQQQYYVDNTVQQQQQQQELYEGQEEHQQLATDQYTGEQQQMYYPSDGPDQATSQDAPAMADGEAPAVVPDAVEDPSRDQPEATKPVDHSSLDTTAVSDPAKDPSVETKNTIPSSTNDPQPATDTPTLSSVNDESDFDFSTQ
ncbi:probable serine/threonine-protein kinase kinX [Anopheles cruzii]|uniref:probable serine/threonine-protein kinase kinX n=1 Tax=Anopheles cruzii TaxID=68878 RepID=UPI0022EC4AB7|nr:probable serine/threonine-protein kinase kinX [Anopheles cruzii]